MALTKKKGKKELKWRFLWTELRCPLVLQMGGTGKESYGLRVGIHPPLTSTPTSQVTHTILKALKSPIKK